MKLLLRFSAILTLVAMTTPAPAAFIEFHTPGLASIQDLPVSASVSFTTQLDTITVVLTNHQADPKAVAQSLSSLMFTISTGQSSATLTGSVATPRLIAGDDSYSDGTPGDTGWQLREAAGGQLDLFVLDTPVGPAHTIIGPPNGSYVYQNANGSIAGNGPHNPFLAEIAEFELLVPGVTEASTITSVTFGFNTGPGDTITVPEPTTVSLLCTVAAVGELWRRRHRKSN